MKHKGERNIPDFSKKPKTPHPVAPDPRAPNAPPPARPQPKPPATSSKSGRRGQSVEPTPTQSGDVSIVLVTGATGRVGRLVVDELLRAGMPVRALTRRPEQAALPAGAEVVAGDLTVPASLDAALDGVGAVFLVWTATMATAAAVVARLETHTSGQPRRVVYLSSPHQTPHPFFQQPNPLRGLHAEVERLLAATSARRRRPPAGDVRLERTPLVGAADPERRRGALAVRSRRDGAGRRARHRGRGRARIARRPARGRRLRPDRPRVAEPSRAGARDR